MGLTMFPSNILSKNYRELTTSPLAEIESTKKLQKEIFWENVWENVWTYMKAGAAGVGAGVFASIFTAGTASLAAGVLTAKRVLEENPPPAVGGSYYVE